MPPVTLGIHRPNARAYMCTIDARNALQRMQQANAMIPDAVGSMLALADPAAADAAAALMNLSGTGHCSDTILAGAGLTVY